MTNSENFSFRHEGKKIKVVTESLGVKVNAPWRSSMLCPWGCGVPIVAVGHRTAKAAFDQIESRVKTHWYIMHRVVKRR